MVKFSIGMIFPGSKKELNIYGRVLKGLSFLLFLFLNLCGFSVLATTISTNTTYTTPNTVPDDLVITNGAIVTVMGTTLSVNGSITIQPGCKLVIINNSLGTISDPEVYRDYAIINGVYGIYRRTSYTI